MKFIRATLEENKFLVVLVLESVVAGVLFLQYMIIG